MGGRVVLSGNPLLITSCSIYCLHVLTVNPLTHKSYWHLISPHDIIPKLCKVMRKKGNDHQLKKFLTVKQILLVNTHRKCIENSMENVHTDSR